MRSLNSDYLTAATQSGRVVGLELSTPLGPLTHKDVISLKIVQGQTTGGYTLGGCYSAVLNLTLAGKPLEGVKTDGSGYIYVYVLMYDPETGKQKGGSVSLGAFYIDQLKTQKDRQIITAYDKVFFGTKEYTGKVGNMTYGFPNDIFTLYQSSALAMGTKPSTNSTYLKSLINRTAIVNELPIVGEDEETGITQYYTNRDILSYAAAVNGGAAYIVNGYVKFSTPRNTGYTIPASSVISATIGETNTKITKVVLNTTGSSMTNSDTYTSGTIEFSVPFDFADPTEVETNLNKSFFTGLKNLYYDAITLKKQGTGMFELGDWVGYRDENNKLYHLLVMGIVYDFTGGFFSETLYSLAKSPSQQMYTGAGYVAGTGVGVYGTGAGWGNNTGWGAGGGIGGGGSSGSGGGTLRKADRARALQTGTTISGTLGSAPAMFINGKKNWSNQAATSIIGVSAGFSTSITETTDNILKNTHPLINTEGLIPQYSSATFPLTEKHHGIIRVISPDTRIPDSGVASDDNDFGICATFYTSGERAGLNSSPGSYKMRWFAQTNIGSVHVSYNDVGDDEPTQTSHSNAIMYPWSYELGSSYLRSEDKFGSRLLYGGGIALWVYGGDDGVPELRIWVAGKAHVGHSDIFEAKIPLTLANPSTVSEPPTTKIASVEKAVKADNTAENDGANVTYGEDGIHIEYKGHKKFIPWD